MRDRIHGVHDCECVVGYSYLGITSGLPVIRSEWQNRGNFGKDPFVLREGGFKRHGPKNILEEIWSDRICAAFPALPFCEQAPSPAAPVGCRLAFQSSVEAPQRRS